MEKKKRGFEQRYNQTRPSISNQTRPYIYVIYIVLFKDIYIYITLLSIGGFPGGSMVKNPPANARDAWFIPGLRRSPGEGNGKPLQYSCLENAMDQGV